MPSSDISHWHIEVVSIIWTKAKQLPTRVTILIQTQSKVSSCHRREKPNQTTNQIFAIAITTTLADLKEHIINIQLCCTNTPHFVSPESGVSKSNAWRGEKWIAALIDWCQETEACWSANPRIDIGEAGGGGRRGNQTLSGKGWGKGVGVGGGVVQVDNVEVEQGGSVVNNTKSGAEWILDDVGERGEGANGEEEEEKGEKVSRHRGHCVKKRKRKRWMDRAQGARLYMRHKRKEQRGERG